MATVPETLFAELHTENDLSALLGVVDETLYREFKRKKDPRHDRIDSDDKRNFSVSLSAFANADGGLLVWGVSTNKVHHRDIASELFPIADVGAFARRLSDLAKDTTQPIVPGVEISVIESARAPRSGYVKCLIPASVTPPHCAIHGEHLYWSRTSDRTYRLEHFQLADMFGTRLKPDLRLEPTISMEGSDLFSISIDLRNLGRASGKDAGWMVRLSDNAQVVHKPPNVENATRGGRSTLLAFNYPNPLHPLPISAGPGPFQFRFIDPKIPVTLDVTWYCENMNYRQRVHTLSFDESTHALTMETA